MKLFTKSKSTILSIAFLVMNLASPVSFALMPQENGNEVELDNGRARSTLNECIINRPFTEFYSERSKVNSKLVPLFDFVMEVDPFLKLNLKKAMDTTDYCETNHRLEDVFPSLKTKGGHKKMAYHLIDNYEDNKSLVAFYSPSFDSSNNSETSRAITILRELLHKISPFAEMGEFKQYKVLKLLELGLTDQKHSPEEIRNYFRSIDFPSISRSDIYEGNYSLFEDAASVCSSSDEENQEICEKYLDIYFLPRKNFSKERCTKKESLSLLTLIGFGTYQKVNKCQEEKTESACSLAKKALENITANLHDRGNFDRLISEFDLILVDVAIQLYTSDKESFNSFYPFLIKHFKNKKPISIRSHTSLSSSLQTKYPAGSSCIFYREHSLVADLYSPIQVLNHDIFVNGNPHHKVFKHPKYLINAEDENSNRIGNWLRTNLFESNDKLIDIIELLINDKVIILETDLFHFSDKNMEIQDIERLLEKKLSLINKDTSLTDKNFFSDLVKTMEKNHKQRLERIATLPRPTFSDRRNEYYEGVLGYRGSENLFGSNLSLALLKVYPEFYTSTNVLNWLPSALPIYRTDINWNYYNNSINFLIEAIKKKVITRNLKLHGNVRNYKKILIAKKRKSLAKKLKK